MTTAREQARKAASREAREDAWSQKNSQRQADASSDVWEPIVQEREKMIRHLIEAGDRLINAQFKHSRLSRWARVLSTGGLALFERPRGLSDAELHWIKSVAEIEEELSGGTQQEHS